MASGSCSVERPLDRESLTQNNLTLSLKFLGGQIHCTIIFGTKKTGRQDKHFGTEGGLQIFGLGAMEEPMHSFIILFKSIRVLCGTNNIP
jgi:hypothetical protein